MATVATVGSGWARKPGRVSEHWLAPGLRALRALRRLPGARRSPAPRQFVRSSHHRATGRASQQQPKETLARILFLAATLFSLSFHPPTVRRYPLIHTHPQRPGTPGTLDSGTGVPPSKRTSSSTTDPDSPSHPVLTMSQVDLVILFLTIALPLLWYFRESLPIIGSKPRNAADAAGLKRGGASADDEGDPRDFVGKMERGVSTYRSLHCFVLAGPCRRRLRAHCSDGCEIRDLCEAERRGDVPPPPRRCTAAHRPCPLAVRRPGPGQPGIARRARQERQGASIHCGMLTCFRAEQALRRLLWFANWYC